MYCLFIYLFIYLFEYINQLKLFLLLAVVSSTTLFARFNEEVPNLKNSEIYSYCWEEDFKTKVGEWRGIDGQDYDVFIIHGGCEYCMDLSGSGSMTSDCWGSRFLGLKDDPRLSDINR